MKKGSGDFLFVFLIFILPIYIIYYICKKLFSDININRTNNHLNNYNQNVSKLASGRSDNFMQSNNYKSCSRGIESKDVERDEELDPILPKALLEFIKTGTGSISAIQSRYQVGYARAARIIDQMERHGFISVPNSTNGNRRILIDESEYNELFFNDFSNISRTPVSSSNIISEPKSTVCTQNDGLTLEEINEISKLFLDIIESYSNIKNEKRIHNFIKSFLKRNDFFLYDRFNFLLYIPSEYSSKINFCADKLLDNIETNENSLIIQYLIKLCQAREKYFNELFFNNSYLNSLNFSENVSQAEFDKFVLSLTESNFILDTFVEKFALFYLMFQERNVLLSEKFYKDYIDRLNLIENKDLYYYAKEIFKYNINMANEDIVMYYDGYYNNKNDQTIVLNEVDTIKNSTILENLREAQERKNYLYELEAETDEDGKFSKIDLDLMSPFDFEQFIADLFKKMGYNSYKTKKSGDQGVDVVAEKAGEKIAIQVKHFFQNSVGNKAIQEVVTGKKYYKAQKCMVITNSSFTKAARELAKANDVILWDGNTLMQKINELDE